MHIDVPTTWSRLSDRQVPWNGQNRTLALHQARALEILERPRSGLRVIIDTAMTGDGKTLVAALAARQQGRAGVLGIYPTRELMRDQEGALNGLSAALGDSERWTVMNAETLDELQEENESDRRYQLIKDVIIGNPRLLMSPDMAHLLISGIYPAAPHMQRKMKMLLEELPSLIVIDEFHLYDAMQLHLILMMIAQIGAHHDVTVLLLSATAQADVVKRLGAMGSQHIEEVLGEYRHQSEDPGLKEPGTQWRAILQSVTLEVIEEDGAGNDADEQGATTEPQSECHGASQWMIPTMADQAQALKRPGHKGLAVLGSLRESRLVLRNAQSNIPLRSQAITSLTPKEERIKAREDASQGGAHLIVATSTVDVGVDFALTHLWFQAWERASFVQRLGRLGRHAIPGAKYQAWTDVDLRRGLERIASQAEKTQNTGDRPAESPWSPERAQAALDNLNDPEYRLTLTRPELYELAGWALGDEASNGTYDRLWAQSALALRLELLAGMVKQTNGISVSEYTRLKERLSKATGVDPSCKEFVGDHRAQVTPLVPKFHGKLQMHNKRKYETSGKKAPDRLDRKIPKEATELLTSIRGSTTQCPIWTGDQWVLMDPLQAVRIGTLNPVPERAMAAWPPKWKTGKSGARALGTPREEPIRITLQIGGEWPQHERSQKAGKLPVLRIVAASVENSEDDTGLTIWLSNQLKNTALIAIILSCKEPSQARATLRMGPLSQVMKILDEENIRRVCIVGRDALMHDCRVEKVAQKSQTTNTESQTF